MRLSTSRSRLRIGALLLLVIAASCGDDRGDGVGARSGQAASLAERAGLRSESVVDAICDGWATDNPDRPTINEYVHDLLLPTDLVNSPDPPAYTSEEIDALVVAGCRDHRDDPEQFLHGVRDRLGLSEDGLEALVQSACDRYRLQQQKIIRGDWSGEVIAQLVRDLAAERDVGLEELREAVDGVCAG